jgi:sulfur carrier protein
MAIRLTVNGKPREMPDGVTVDVAVTAVTSHARLPRQFSGVAAAVNGEVVPRRSWAGRVLRDGDRVEVVTAVQGG